MRELRWWLGLGALLWVACAGPPRDDPPEVLRELAVAGERLADPPLPLAPIYEGPLRCVRRLPMVEVGLPGGRTVWAVVDTGAGTPVVLDLAVADALGLPRRNRVAVASQGELTQAWAIELPSVRLGGVELGPVSGLAHDLSSFRPLLGADYGAILGFPLFAGAALELDYPGRRLRLLAPSGPLADGRETLDYELLDNTPVVACQVGTWEIPLTVDTGCSYGLLLPHRMSPRLSWKGPPVEGASPSLSVTGYASYSVALLDGPLVLGRHRFDDPAVLLGPGFIGLLGGEVLEHFQLRFDPDSRTVRFVRPGRS